MRIPALLPADHPQTLDVLPLKLAAQAIAARCDGAISLDYMGFDGQDTKFGKRVAALPAEAWTPAIARETWEMLRKYRRQLQAAAGIDYDALPEPPAIDTGSGLDSARQDARRRLAGASVTLDMDDATARILVRAPYSEEAVEAARRLPGQRWNPELKARVLPAEPAAAHAAVLFAEQFALWVDAEVQELAGRHNGASGSPTGPPAPVQPSRLVALEAGRLVATIRGGGGGFQEALTAIKSIQGRVWRGEEKVWEIPQTPGAAVDIRSIADLYGFTLTPAARELVDRLADQGEALHAASSAVSADLEIPGLGGTLYPFQQAGVAYCLNALGFIPNPNYGGRDATRGLFAPAGTAGSGQSEPREGTGAGRQGEGSPADEGDRLGSGLAGEGQPGHAGSDASPGNSGAAPGRTGPVGETMAIQGRQRPAADTISGQDGRSAGTLGVREGVPGQNQGTRDSAQGSIELQGGFRAPGATSGDRDGRIVTPLQGTAAARPEKDRGAESPWVASDPGTTRGGVIVGDVMGLGKTPQALAVLQATNSFPAVAVVPANLRLNWEREAHKWLPGRAVRIITGRARQLDYSADFIVIGYDVLKDHVDSLIELHPKAVVMDEGHYLKSGKAQRTVACRELVEGANPPIRLALTGTPVPNNAKELIPQLRILGRLNDLGGYKEYERRYVYGMRLTELNDRLRQVCYVRRTKVDVLPELPPVQRSQVPVELSNEREYRHAEAAFIAWLREKVTAGLMAEGTERTDAEDAGWRAAHRAMQAEALVRIGKLRQLAAEGKIDATISWVRGFLNDSAGDKLIVFAHHREVQALLADAFPDAAQIVASKAQANQEAVDRFQTDSSCRLIIVSLMAGGLGFTLTAASHMAIVELPWTPKDLDQAEGRAYGRMADVHGLNAYYIHAPGSIDDEMAETIEAKRQITDAIQDGKEVTDVEVLNDLLKKLLRRR